MEKDTVD